MNYQYIDSSDSLKTFCDQAKQFSALGIDTEFIRERTYYPQLCLLQISLPDSVGIIDPLGLDDLGPLESLLLDPSITKIFHAGRQDQEIFYYLWKKLPAPVFDTQVAASMLGVGDQVGYGKLISTEFGKELDKTQSRTDWSKRPLSEKQLDYAADDVRYLIPLYEKQKAQLDEQGRLDWLDSDFEILTSKESYEPDLENLWKKVKGVQRLKGKDLAVLKHLTIWREDQAQSRDRPRRHVISDDALIDLARSKPANQEDLGRFRSLTPGQAQKFGDELISVVQKACALDKNDWPHLDKRRSLTTEEDAIIDILSGALKLLANQHSIHPGRVANRQALQSLLNQEEDAELMHGWKFTHFGKPLLKILRGEQALLVEGKGIQFIDKESG